MEKFACKDCRALAPPPHPCQSASVRARTPPGGDARAGAYQGMPAGRADHRWGLQCEVGSILSVTRYHKQLSPVWQSVFSVNLTQSTRKKVSIRNILDEH